MLMWQVVRYLAKITAGDLSQQIVSDLRTIARNARVSGNTMILSQNKQLQPLQHALYTNLSEGERYGTLVVNADSIESIVRLNSRALDALALLAKQDWTALEASYGATGASKIKAAYSQVAIHYIYGESNVDPSVRNKRFFSTQTKPSLTDAIGHPALAAIKNVTRAENTVTLNLTGLSDEDRLYVMNGTTDKFSSQGNGIKISFPDEDEARSAAKLYKQRLANLVPSDEEPQQRKFVGKTL